MRTRTIMCVTFAELVNNNKVSCRIVMRSLKMWRVTPRGRARGAASLAGALLSARGNASPHVYFFGDNAPLDFTLIQENTRLYHAEVLMSFWIFPIYLVRFVYDTQNVVASLVGNKETCRRPNCIRSMVHWMIYFSESVHSCQFRKIMKAFKFSFYNTKLSCTSALCD